MNGAVCCGRMAAFLLIPALVTLSPAPAVSDSEAPAVRVLDLSRRRAEEPSRLGPAWEPSRSPLVQAASILPATYPIYPFGGLFDIDLHAFDYVDLDAGPGVQDWMCGANTYDGHDAVDFWLKSFGEQEGGVPVFAPLAGVVTHAQDGYPDRQKECSPNTENYVLLDHGNGLTTGYGHLRRGSVRVTEGQRVEPGEELGMIASSGCSYWPHLHFRTRVDGAVVEPHTGPCNPGESGFRKQRPMGQGPTVWDFGFSRRGLESLEAEELPPEPLPRLGHIGRRDRHLHAWAYVIGLPASASYRVRAYAPDGALGYDSGARVTDNPESLRLAVAWVTVPTRSFRKRYGTWTVELELDGEVVVEAPVDFGKKRKPRLNRPPVRPRRVRIEPRAPTPGESLTCLVRSDHLLDDPDYDIVRYHFEWKINGEVVRQRTWAACSDVLPASRVRSGDRVRCTVVPLDDQTAGRARATSVAVP